MDSKRAYLCERLATVLMSIFECVWPHLLVWQWIPIAAKLLFPILEHVFIATDVRLSYAHLEAVLADALGVVVGKPGAHRLLGLYYQIVNGYSVQSVSLLKQTGLLQGVGKTAAGHLKPIAGPLLVSAIPSDRLGSVLPVADLALKPLFGLVRQPVQ